MADQPMSRRLLSPQINRRNFMNSAVLLGGSALALSACGTGNTSSIGTSSASATATGKARRGGTVQMEIPFYATDTLDPAKAGDEFTQLVTGHIFDPLVTVDQSWTVTPVLAEKFSSNSGSNIWTFQLRDGVTFHNGKKLTAADVVYSVQRQFTVKGNALASISGYLDPKNVKALDDKTVQFTLTKPNAFFDIVLASDAFAVVPDGFTDFTKPVGTGPFKFKTYSQSNYVELVRNPNYWQNGLPYLDGLRFVHGSDGNAMLQSVITGQSQIINGIDYSLLPVLKSASNVQTIVKKNGVYMPLSLDQRQAPFKDVRVRQAFKMAVDRNRYVQQAFQGYGSVTPDIPVPPDDPFFPTSVKPYEYDPTGALKLLKAAGYPLNETITIYAESSGDGSSEAAVVHAGLLNEAGIKTKIVQQDLDTWATNAFLKKPAAESIIFRNHWTALLQQIYMKGAVIPQSYFAGTNPQFDSNALAAIGTKDPEESKAKLAAAMAILNEQSGELIPGYADRIYPATQNLHGVKLTFITGYVVDFREAYLS